MVRDILILGEFCGGSVTDETLEATAAAARISEGGVLTGVLFGGGRSSRSRTVDP